MALTQIDDRGLKTPIDLIDNEKIRLGTGNDFELYHDGSNSYLKNSTGALHIRNDGIYFKNAAGSENFIDCSPNAEVSLFYDNAKKFETTQYGAKISTTLSAGYLEVSTTGNLGDGHIEIKGGEGGGSILSFTADEGDDNADYWRIQNAGDSLLGFRSKESGSWVEKFRIQSDGRVQIPNDTGKYECGSSGDLQIYHDGSNSYLKNTTGRLDVSSTSYLYLESDDRVYIGNVGMSEVSAVFIKDGAVELYHNNVKKLETASNGVHLNDSLFIPDNEAANFGTGNDLGIFHDGSNSYIDSNTGELQIRTAYLRIRAKDDGETIATFDDDAGIDLYYNGVKTFATQTNGIAAYGAEGNDAYIFIFPDEQDDLADQWRIRGWQASQTLSIEYRNGSGTYENSILCNGDGNTKLFYNNEEKLETLSNGVGLNGDSTSCALRFKSDGSIRGYFYADGSSNTGHLDNGGSWKFKIENDGDYIFYGSNVSDRDKKDNITTVTGTSLDKITKLVPKTYNWKNLDGITPTDKTFTGFIAQEVKEHLPSLVTGTDGQKNMAVDYNGILAYAVKAITELSAEVETLKTKVAALEAA